MTQQTQRLLDEVVVGGSSTYGGDRLRLPRLRIGCETSPFTNRTETLPWSSGLAPMSGDSQTPATERTFAVCIVALEGALSALQDAFRPQQAAVQFEPFDALLITGNEYWTADPGCIFEVRSHDVGQPFVVLEGPDGAVHAPAAALRALADAYSEYDEAIRAAEKVEADDWVYAD